MSPKKNDVFNPFQTQLCLVYRRAVYIEILESTLSVQNQNLPCEKLADPSVLFSRHCSHRIDLSSDENRGRFAAIASSAILNLPGRYFIYGNVRGLVNSPY